MESLGLGGMSSTQHKFPCTACGSCCKRAFVLRDWFAEHGIEINADGSCEHLTADNRCRIYESRPSFCRVGNAKPEDMPIEEYWIATARVCNAWMDQDGVPVELRIDDSAIKGKCDAVRMVREESEERDSPKS